MNSCRSEGPKVSGVKPSMAILNSTCRGRKVESRGGFEGAVSRSTRGTERMQACARPAGRRAGAPARPARRGEVGGRQAAAVVLAERGGGGAGAAGGLAVLRRGALGLHGGQGRRGGDGVKAGPGRGVWCRRSILHNGRWAAYRGRRRGGGGGGGGGPRRGRAISACPHQLEEGGRLCRGGARQRGAGSVVRWSKRPVKRGAAGAVGYCRSPPTPS